MHVQVEWTRIEKAKIEIFPGQHAVARATRALPSASLAAGGLLLFVSLALGAATVAFGVVVFAFLRVSGMWNRMSIGDTEFGASAMPDYAVVSKSMRSEAAALVSLQGVVLTLVFAFVGTSDASAVVEVGAVALVTGICLGLLFASLTTLGISTPAQRTFSFVMFSWTL